MSDLTAMHSVFGDPEVMRFEGETRSEAWIRDWLRQNIKRKKEIACWAVDGKSSRETIGYCGLFHFPDIDGRPETEIGYRLARTYWGQGYATEAARSVRDYAFNTLNVPRLVALIDPGNYASINVAKKIGFTYEKEVMLEEYTYSDHLYAKDITLARILHQYPG